MQVICSMCMLQKSNPCKLSVSFCGPSSIERWRPTCQHIQLPPEAQAGHQGNPKLPWAEAPIPPSGGQCHEHTALPGLHHALLPSTSMSLGGKKGPMLLMEKVQASQVKAYPRLELLSFRECCGDTRGTSGLTFQAKGQSLGVK